MELQGFGMGIMLLIVLTIVVDWTIRLLIYNSKLASCSTYQDLLEAAFGRLGLVAISVFQFAFAFGGKSVFVDTGESLTRRGTGMCAYGVILGKCGDVARSLLMWRR